MAPGVDRGAGGVRGRRFAVCWLLACFAATAASAKPRKRYADPAAIPEASLLDVGVEIFDAGMPDDEDALLDLALEGIYEDVRKSEARYLPVRMTETLQATGAWGAVRTVPVGTDNHDLIVSGRIEVSNGTKLSVAVRAVDATGRVWLDQRYRHSVSEHAYREPADGTCREPFQGVYDRIADDLLAVRRKLGDDRMSEIRSIRQLRYAAGVLPHAYADYLTVDRKGLRAIARLPAADDPTLQRIARLRDRDRLLIDTLSEHYAAFSDRMREPYQRWRELSYEEERSRAKLKRQAGWRKVRGAALLAAGAAIAMEGAEATEGLPGLAVTGGIHTLYSGIMAAREARFHVLALRELAASFNAEVEPMLLDVEGQTLRLSGSIEAQYAQWRRVVRDYFAAETGLLLDPSEPPPP